MNSFSLDSDPIAYQVCGYGSPHPSRTPWVLSRTAPGSDSMFCVPEPASPPLPLPSHGFFKLSCLYEFWAACLFLLIGTAFSHFSLSLGSRLLFPYRGLTLLTRCPDTHWPHLSALLLQCLVCPYCQSWPSLACPVLRWSYLTCDPWHRLSR